MNSLIENYILSEEGYDFLNVFTKRFDSGFMHDETVDSLIYSMSKQNKSFKIPESETVENLKNAVAESLKQNKDLLYERYKEYEIVWDEYDDEDY